MRQYLNSIGKVALLNAEQEVGTIPKDIEAGLYAEQLLRGHPSVSGIQYNQAELETIAAIWKKSL